MKVHTEEAVNVAFGSLHTFMIVNPIFSCFLWKKPQKHSDIKMYNK